MASIAPPEKLCIKKKKKKTLNQNLERLGLQNTSNMVRDYFYDIFTVFFGTMLYGKRGSRHSTKTSFAPHGRNNIRRISALSFFEEKSETY